MSALAELQEAARTASTNLQAALDLADEGRPVFPWTDIVDAKGKSVKKPATARGHLDAMLDPKHIRGAWTLRPDALIGVPTGRVSDLLVIDVDPRHGGEAWEHTYAHLLHGARVHTTRSGGRHYLFTHYAGLSSTAGTIAPGIDLRTDGGWIAWWPAHGYATGGGDIGPASIELLALLRSAGKPTRTTDRSAADIAPPRWQDVVDLLDAMPNPAETTRDEYLSVMFSAVGSIQGLEAAGLPCDADEIRRAACEWAMRWELHDGTDEFTKWDEDLIKRETPLAGWPSLLRHAGRLAPEWAEAYRQRYAGEEFGSVPLSPEHDAADADLSPAATGRALRLLTVHDVMNQPEPEWLVHGLIPERSLTLLYGAPKEGKTFVALSMAWHIAAGHAWFGHAVKQGAVVYIAGEGAAGLMLRQRALQTHHGFTPQSLYVLPQAIDFRDGAAVAAMGRLVRDTVGSEPVRLVVIDTLARAMPGADENSASDMGRVIAECDKLGRALGCTVMPVHHAGHNAARERGSSALGGAVDAKLSVTKEKVGTGNVVTLRTEWQKDSEEAPPLHLDMIKVAATDNRSSLVPVLRGGPPIPRAKPLTEPAQAALNILAEITSEMTLRHEPPVTSLQKWREACVASGKVSGASDKRSREQAFRRAYETLSRRGLVSADEDENIGLGADVFAMVSPVAPGEIVALLDGCYSATGCYKPATSSDLSQPTEPAACYRQLHTPRGCNTVAATVAETEAVLGARGEPNDGASAPAAPSSPDDDPVPLYNAIVAGVALPTSSRARRQRKRGADAKRAPSARGAPDNLPSRDTESSPRP